MRLRLKRAPLSGNSSKQKNKASSGARRTSQVTGQIIGIGRVSRLSVQKRSVGDRLLRPEKSRGGVEDFAEPLNAGPHRLSRTQPSRCSSVALAACCASRHQDLMQPMHRLLVRFPSSRRDVLEHHVFFSSPRAGPMILLRRARMAVCIAKLAGMLELNYTETPNSFFTRKRSALSPFTVSQTCP